MSGKLTLASGSGGKQVVLTTALSAAGALALLSILALALRQYLTVELSRGAEAVVLAILAYVTFRVFYGVLGKALPGDTRIRTVAWAIDGGVLTLDGKSIPLDSIRQVHCWPNRDALGHNLPGWTVNIETTGQNRLLRSVAEGPAEALSTRQLHALVDALGYGNRWQSNG